jgi:hypothetical protein
MMQCLSREADLSNKQTQRPESASDLYRLSDSCLPAKLVPTFADRGYHMVSVTDPYGRIVGFLKLIYPVKKFPAFCEPQRNSCATEFSCSWPKFQIKI